MTQLKEAIIVLTGASGGFGQQFTRQLLQAQSHLILTDIDETLLRQQVQDIQKEVKTGKVLACWGIDLQQQNSCQILYERIQSLNVSVDILINNAGIGLYGRMDELPQDKWEQLMQINLLVPMRLSTLLTKDMISRRKGHIVNLSSVAGWIAAEGITPYSTSKFGLRGFSEGLFQDVKQYNVKVTVVYPFFSRTPILQSKQYGLLAQEKKSLPNYLTTDPAKIIERTLISIQKDKLHVFPDIFSKILTFIKQHFPFFLDFNWLRKIAK
ncbi:MAG: SDR family NAD(P)-dependent oxidoreductase [Microcystaceae cyanobacterium]